MSQRDMTDHQSLTDRCQLGLSKYDYNGFGESSVSCCKLVVVASLTGRSQAHAFHFPLLKKAAACERQLVALW
jgi:hypothetical protein